MGGAVPAAVRVAGTGVCGATPVGVGVTVIPDTVSGLDAPAMSETRTAEAMRRSNARLDCLAEDGTEFSGSPIKSDHECLVT